MQCVKQALDAKASSSRRRPKTNISQNVMKFFHKKSSRRKNSDAPNKNGSPHERFIWKLENILEGLPTASSKLDTDTFRNAISHKSGIGVHSVKNEWHDMTLNCCMRCYVASISTFILYNLNKTTFGFSTVEKNTAIHGTTHDESLLAGRDVHTLTRFSLKEKVHLYYLYIPDKKYQST